MIEYKKDKKFLRELRCPHCRALLGKEYLLLGRIQIKCWRTRCKETTTFNFKSITKLLEETKSSEAPSETEAQSVD